MSYERHRIPRPEAVGAFESPRKQKPKTQLSKEQARRAADVLIGQIVAVIRTGKLSMRDPDRHIYAGWRSDDSEKTPVLSAVATQPWCDVQVAAIVARRFRSQGWDVWVSQDGAFGVRLPKDKYGHLLRN